MYKLTHRPVMLKEVLEVFGLKSPMIVVDATLGAGGHAEAMLKEVLPDGFLIGIDKDPFVIKPVWERLSKVSKNFKLYCTAFSDIDRVILKAGFKIVDRILFDLGVSMMQLKTPQRGFSFDVDGPLDMRMRRSGITAYEVLNSFSQKELAFIFKKYGEERFANRIARHIVLARKKAPISTTLQLVKVIREALPLPLQRKMGRHPARKIFQALRIYVNNELSELETALRKSANLLKIGGKLAVISYHSLEDRITKHIFKEFVQSGSFEFLTKKPIYPSSEELQSNRSARSAKMRVLIRVT